ncbi:MAG: hypothetical protein K1X88_02815 [Nannocystaceae bacterium]|nr:hypothetical protein [Nannocystaceae bacterium]
MDRSAAATGAAAVLAIACHGAAPSAQGEDSSSTGPIDRPAPDFLEPAGGELHLEVDRTLDVDLDVFATPGVTRLLLDGRSLGTLAPSGPAGELADGRLRLYLRGGLVPSHHTLQLTTPDVVSKEDSEVVDVFVDPVQIPTLQWALGETIGAADALVVGGSGERGALALIDRAVAPVQATVLPAAGTGWDPARARTVALPELTAAAPDAVAIEGGAAQLTIAWLRGDPATALWLARMAWDEPTQPAAALALQLSSQWLGPYEWAELSTPLLLGDEVFAQALAPRDVETPRPGDRVIVRERLGPAGPAGDPSRLPLPTLDHDALAAVLDPLADAVGRDVFALRRDNHTLALFDRDRERELVDARASHAASDDPVWAEIQPPILQLVGALGSRTAFGLGRDGRSVQALTIDDSGATPVGAAVVPLPDDAPASGAPALALVDGAAVLLVPRGAAEIVVVTTTAGVGVAEPLAGAHCDAVAVPRSDAGNAQAAVAVACLRERTVTMATLSRP